MHCFRIGDARFPLFDATGARLYGGRWNSPGRAVIYAAETYSGAILEILVHANLNRLPRTHALLTIEVPADVTVERLAASDLPGWDLPNQAISRAFGDRWLDDARREHNVLLNPAHPDFARIAHSRPEPVAWDERLFAR
jgi:RES domain-containing protein